MERRDRPQRDGFAGLGGAADWTQMPGLRAAERRYNRPMVIARFVIYVLEGMFFVGLAGSAVVVLISFVEDGKELFGKDEPHPPRA